jgi:hypothetical protein
MDQRSDQLCSARNERIEPTARAIEKHDRGEKLTPVEEQIVAYTIYASGCSVCGTQRRS